MNTVLMAVIPALFFLSGMVWQQLAIIKDCDKQGRFSVNDRVYHCVRS